MGSRVGAFFAGPFLIGIGVLVGGLVGYGFYVLGGLPKDHDRYGEVAVPGAAVLKLPSGDVRLNFENHATQSGDSTSVDGQPDGLEIQVTPAAGGAPLDVKDVPSWIFSSTTDDRGHEPEGKVDIPSEGDYLVQATDDADGGKFPKPTAAAPAPSPPKIDDGAAISVGAKPWAPFGSPLFGGILIGLAILGGCLLLSLPFRLMGLTGRSST